MWLKLSTASFALLRVGASRLLPLAQAACVGAPRPVLRCPDDVHRVLLAASLAYSPRGAPGGVLAALCGDAAFTDARGVDVAGDAGLLREREYLAVLADGGSEVLFLAPGPPRSSGCMGCGGGGGGGAAGLGAISCGHIAAVMTLDAGHVVARAHGARRASLVTDYAEFVDRVVLRLPGRGRRVADVRVRAAIHVGDDGSSAPTTARAAGPLPGAAASSTGTAGQSGVKDAPAVATEILVGKAGRPPPGLSAPAVAGAAAAAGIAAVAVEPDVDSDELFARIIGSPHTEVRMHMRQPDRCVRGLTRSAGPEMGRARAPSPGDRRRDSCRARRDWWCWRCVQGAPRADTHGARSSARGAPAARIAAAVGERSKTPGSRRRAAGLPSQREPPTGAAAERRCRRARNRPVGCPQCCDARRRRRILCGRPVPPARVCDVRGCGGAMR